MFIELTHFGFKRNPTQAVGFGISYLIVTILVSTMLGGVIALFSGNADSIDFSRAIGRFIEAGITAWIGYTVVAQKQIKNEIGVYALVVLAAFLSFLVGSLVGLAIVAYMTMWPARSSEEQKPHQ